jgi:calcium-dependent protein kinase
MEYCKGGELFDRIIAQHKFHERSASEIMTQMLSAVRHLHVNGIVHRDLKPENFMLASTDADSEIKLIDFGLSKRFMSVD